MPGGLQGWSGVEGDMKNVGRMMRDQRLGGAYIEFESKDNRVVKVVKEKCSNLSDDMHACTRLSIL